MDFGAGATDDDGERGDGGLPESWDVCFGEHPLRVRPGLSVFAIASRLSRDQTMNNDRENWRILFVVVTVFVVLVIAFAWHHNGRTSYPPIVP